MSHLPEPDPKGRVDLLFDGIFRLRLPTPYRVGDTNAYVFTGDGYFDIVDPGPALEGNVDLLNEALSPYRLNARHARRILLTHGHEDHGGLSAALSKSSGGQVMIGRGDIPMLGTNMKDEFRSRRLQVLERFRRLGFRGGALDLVSEHYRSRDYYRDSPARETVAALDGGERVDTGSGALQVVGAPGHTLGSVCYLLEERGVLFSGDTLIGHLTPNPGALLYYHILFEDDLKINSLKTFVESLGRLARMGVGRAWPGHGEPIGDVGSLVDDYLRHHRRRIDRIVEDIRGRERNCVEIAESVFGSVKSFDDLVLQVMEVLAHLIFLEETGEVRRKDSGSGPVMYGLRSA